MSASKGFRTPDASDNTEPAEVNLNLKTVQRMLPLVQRIVQAYESHEMAREP